MRVLVIVIGICTALAHNYTWYRYFWFTKTPTHYIQDWKMMNKTSHKCSTYQVKKCQFGFQSTLQTRIFSSNMITGVWITLSGMKRVIWSGWDFSGLRGKNLATKPWTLRRILNKNHALFPRCQDMTKTNALFIAILY